MSAVPIPIAVDGDTYTVPGADTIEPLAVSVTYDGSGAGGDFLPCLTYYSQSGALISRTFPGSSVAAGSSAEVSFIPFVPPASGTGGAALPKWTNILGSLSLNYGTLGGASFAKAMVQASTLNSSVFVFLRLVLSDNGGASAVPYTVVGLPSVQYAPAQRISYTLAQGASSASVPGTFVPRNGSYIDGDGTIRTTLDTDPVVCGDNYATGDVIFAGYGVYPWNPN